MALLKKEDFLLPLGHKTKDVFVEEFGGEVRLRTLTAEEQFTYSKLFAGGVNNIAENFQVVLIAMCAIDEEGKQLFAKEDQAFLAMQPASAISKLFEVAAELNALNKGAVEKLEKNSEKTESAASPSA